MKLYTFFYKNKCDLLLCGEWDYSFITYNYNTNIVHMEGYYCGWLTFITCSNPRTYLSKNNLPNIDSATTLLKNLLDQVD